MDIFNKSLRLCLCWISKSKFGWISFLAMMLKGTRTLWFIFLSSDLSDCNLLWTRASIKWPKCKYLSSHTPCMRLKRTCRHKAIVTLLWERPRSWTMSSGLRHALHGCYGRRKLWGKKHGGIQRFRVTVCDPAARQRRWEISLLHRSSFNVLGASDITSLGVSYRTRNVPFPIAISLAEPIQAALICFMDHWTFSRVRPRCASSNRQKQAPSDQNLHLASHRCWKCVRFFREGVVFFGYWTKLVSLPENLKNLFQYSSTVSFPGA